MKKPQPPKLARKIFEWHCGSAQIDDLLGDMDEWFYKNAETKSAFTAKMLYWKQVLQLLVSYAIRKRKQNARHGQFASSSISLSMLQNYLKVSSRSLYRHKYFSIVNALGLAIGMCISLLLIAMYSYVLSYENFHANKENIYRVISTRTEGINQDELASVPAALLDKLQSEFPAIQKPVRINTTFNNEAVLEKQNIMLEGIYAEPNFLKLFNFPLLSGNLATALEKPNSITLTESISKKLFNKTDVLGQSLEIKGVGLFEITGILRDLPRNTHFAFDVLVSYNSLPKTLTEAGDSETWTNYRNNYLYLELPENFDQTAFQSALDKIAAETYSKASPVKATFELQPLLDINPGPDLSNSPGPNWDNTIFIVFGAIGLLILLPACFNYTNISIARALKRSKEIGLRKTMGGLKNHIFFQFITETVIITFISFLGALLLFFVIRDEFQSMLVDASALDLSLTWRMTAMFVAFTIFTGFMAGFFPALYFADLNPIQALKNQAGSKALSGLRVRKGLTIFQFVLSFCFILTLVVSSRQYRYSLNFDFGFQKENILDVELQGVNPNVFQTAFGKLASVQGMSMSSSIMGLWYSSTMVHPAGKPDSTEVSQIYVDERFIPNMGLRLLAGKNFPEGVWHREQYMIVNEEFIKTHNIKTPVEALGQTFLVDGHELEVIGVLKNFHFASLQVPIRSFMFRNNPGQFQYANLKTTFSDAYGGLSQMEGIWKTLNDRDPFRAKFFNDEINEAYDFYHALLKIVGFLGLLAISISLLGMLGMVVYTSEQRTKEVGIRKVLGASAMGITLLLSKDYAKLMFWAFLIGIPIATLVLNQLLSMMQHYSVRLNVWDVLISLGILIFLGLATIASQTLKTANTNPAETLKYE